MTNPIQSSQDDRDSLFVMPLSMVPLQTPALRGARLVKNSKLESMIEIFSNEDTGSGQLAIGDLPGQFGWDETEEHPDYRIMKRLVLLPSYDVYSLRLALRELEIDIADVSTLQLSDAKKSELTTYMTMFTHPLIKQIYGDAGADNISSFEDVLALFRSPDVADALARLKQMAEKLNIRPEAVPDFLEDYGDIFMSLSYYRQCLDTIEPIITAFLDALRELRQGFQFKEDLSFIATTREVEAVVNEVMAGVTGRFESFDRSSHSMWQDISAERFKEVSKLIRSFHKVNGGVLCALWVKMHAWDSAFPTASIGSPSKRGEFVQSDFKQGMGKMLKLERSAPKLEAIR